MGKPINPATRQAAIGAKAAWTANLGENQNMGIISLYSPHSRWLYR